MAVRVTAADLKGRHSISYLRFSSSPQERGSSIDRQQKVLDDAIAHYGLIVDQTLIDRAKSASKGHHRTRGELADLIAAIRGGFIPRGTVLIVEAIDRLFREGAMDVFSYLKDWVQDRGLVLVVGNDLTIYCEAAINGDLSHKLLAEVNAAKDYAVRLSEMAFGAHAARRRKVEAFANDPDHATVPVINGILPAWLTRTKGKNDYRLQDDHTDTLRLIFDLYAGGSSCRQIAESFTKDTVPLFHGMKAWRSPRIGAILRDRHTIGMYMPTRKGEKSYHRIAIGPEVQIFPTAIDAETWLRVQDRMDGSKHILVGARGRTVPNLFTGHIFCRTCGAAMRVDTGGGIRNGVRKRHMLCGSYVEKGGCADKTRYDLAIYERDILFALLRLTRIAPKTPLPDRKRIDDEIARIRIEIEQNQAAIDALIPRIAKSATLADTVEKLSVQIDGLRRRLTDLRLESEAVASATTRADEVWAFFTSLVRPAIRGDVEARDRLRGLLVRMNYRIEGHPDVGLIVSTPDGSEHIGDGVSDDPDDGIAEAA